MMPSRHSFDKSNKSLIPADPKAQFTSHSVFFLISLPLEKFVLTDTIGAFQEG